MNELCLCYDSALQLLHIILIVLIEWLCTPVLNTGNFGKIVTLYHLGLKPGYIFTLSVPRVSSGGTTVTLLCCACVLYSCTPKWNLLCFSSTFPFLRDLSQLAYFSCSLCACLSILHSVHCNSVISNKYYHICCSAIWWDFSCIQTCYYHQAVRSF